MDLERVLRHAVALGASDVHLKYGQPPVIRRDGHLERLDHPQLTAVDLSAVLDAVTMHYPHRRESFAERRELDVAYAPPGLARFRVTGFVQRGTLAFAFRLIPDAVPSFEELRLPPGVSRLAEERQGLLVVTGATGSGKTTTLAAIVDHINRTRSQHIVTIEDPIEILHPDRSCIINQRDVGDDTASYQEGLRRALRQDPDVIVIGELRDEESAQTALNAAESGHLVLTTLHTIDAAETVKRLVDFFSAAKQPLVRNILAGVLRGVISQRLLPKVGGGRVVAVEVMVRNARIADAIREDRPHEITAAIKEGSYFDMQTLTQALLQLVVGGEADREVAAGAASNRHDFMIALRDAGLSLPEDGLLAARLPVEETPRVDELAVRRPAP
jgi:twitching motility protein PilT